MYHDSPTTAIHVSHCITHVSSPYHTWWREGIHDTLYHWCITMYHECIRVDAQRTNHARRDTQMIQVSPCPLCINLYHDPWYMYHLWYSRDTSWYTVSPGSIRGAGQLWVTYTALWVTYAARWREIQRVIRVSHVLDMYWTCIARRGDDTLYHGSISKY